MSTRDEILKLRDRIAASIIGQREVIDLLIIGLLANGHLLLEGPPICSPRM
jgi:MoxR-like ATPase